ncbi:hypothetical protein SteCoe_16718 [Stentor coeruleus]|uniref:Uncharacterized protein n=1 Tax=Stentor coeruleus TaxID=5963 RepID=A0A1R2C0J9_9CILI|nr:hypothetical protein SteCoe_16718 [Stentor coeruleus]
MKKYSPDDSLQYESKHWLPRLRNLKHDISSFSPPNSNNTSLTQASFSLAPQNKAIKIPRLNARPIISNKIKSVERNAGDNDYFSEYKKSEIKLSRKIFNDQHPFWFMSTMSLYENFLSKDEEFSSKNVQTDRNGLQGWLDGMHRKLSEIGLEDD